MSDPTRGALRAQLAEIAERAERECVALRAELTSTGNPHD